MNKLTDEQVEYIINEYGASKSVISKIESILNVHNFTEEEYYYLVIQIANEYETNILNDQIGSDIKCNTLNEVIIKVLKYNLKEYSDNLYSEEMANIIKKLMLTKSEI
ncbi:MAG: hypothetical protein IJD92_00725 [Bacilli bacterium]|nr:hypothetical protein [Bacilli bacterium]